MEKDSIRKDREYGALGSVAQTLYDFIQKDMHPDAILTDRIQLADVPARDYFTETSYRFVVKPERLLFDIDVKAAFVYKSDKNSKIPILEVSALDFFVLGDAIVKEFGSQVRLESRTFVAKDSTTLLRTITHKRYVGKRPVERTIIYITPKFSETVYADLSLKVLDTIYNNDAFRREKELQEKLESLGLQHGDRSYAKAPKLELRQELSQILQLEQRPSMTTVQVPAMILRAEIMQLPLPEIEARLKDCTDDLSAIWPAVRRAGIQRIRSVRPDLTWGQAERVYRRIISRQTSQRGDKEQ